MDRMLSDFPKIECPFIRRNFEVNKQQWQKHGRRLNMREPQAYLVVNEINPGYEWVFEDKETFAVEKLDGSNVKLKTENGRLVAMQNRLNVIDPLQIIKGKTFLIEGVFMSIGKGYVAPDGEQAGELLGPKVQGNPYKLPVHEWYPFTKAIKDLRYTSFDEHERTFENWSSWFKDYLVSRFFIKRSPKGVEKEKIMAEGVVFYNLKRKAEGKTHMAKLRRDMFDWYYSDKIEIYGYGEK